MILKFLSRRTKTILPLFKLSPNLVHQQPFCTNKLEDQKSDQTVKQQQQTEPKEEVQEQAQQNLEHVKVEGAADIQPQHKTILKKKKKKQRIIRPKNQIIPMLKMNLIEKSPQQFQQAIKNRFTYLDRIHHLDLISLARLNKSRAKLYKKLKNTWYLYIEKRFKIYLNFLDQIGEDEAIAESILDWQKRNELLAQKIESIHPRYKVQIAWMRIKKFVKPIQMLFNKILKFKFYKIVPQHHINFLLFIAVHSKSLQRKLINPHLFQNYKMTPNQIQRIINTVYVHKSFSYLLNFIHFLNPLPQSSKDLVKIRKRVLYKVTRNQYLQWINKLQVYFYIMKVAPQTFPKVIDIEAFVLQLEKIRFGRYETNKSIKARPKLAYPRPGGPKRAIRIKLKHYIQKEEFPFYAKLRQLVRYDLDLLKQTPLAYFIAQNFFLCNKFEDGMRMLVLQILLFSRLCLLGNHENTSVNLNDILCLIDAGCSEQFFKEYYYNKLPNILLNHWNKQLYDAYRINIEKYKRSRKYTKQYAGVICTYFDQKFRRCTQNIYIQNQIKYYNPKANNCQVHLNIQYNPLNLHSFIQTPIIMLHQIKQTPQPSNLSNIRQQKQQLIKAASILKPSQIQKIQTRLLNKAKSILQQFESMQDPDDKLKQAQRKLLQQFLNTKLFKDPQTNQLFSNVITSNYSYFFYQMGSFLRSSRTIQYQFKINQAQNQLKSLNLADQDAKYLYRLKKILPIYFKLTQPVKYNDFFRQNMSRQQHRHLVYTQQQLEYWDSLPQRQSKYKRPEWKYLNKNQIGMKNSRGYNKFGRRQNNYKTRQKKYNNRQRMSNKYQKRIRTSGGSNIYQKRIRTVGVIKKKEKGVLGKALFSTQKQDNLSKYFEQMRQVDRKVELNLQKSKLKQQVKEDKEIKVKQDKEQQNKAESVYDNIKIKINPVGILQNELIKCKNFQQAYSKILFYINYKKQQLIQSLLKFTNKLPYFSTGQQTFISLFLYAKSQLTEKIPHNPKLQLKVDAHIGSLEKDYNKYLLNQNGQSLTIFPFQISPMAYNVLLEQMEHLYKRYHFKKILAHLISYSTNLPFPVIQKICKIIKKQKSGVMLLQFTYLVINAGIQIKQQSLKMLFQQLCGFKDVGLDCFQIYKNALNTQKNWTYKPDIIQPFIGVLIRQQKQEMIQQVIKTFKQSVQKKYKFNQKLSLQQNQKIQKSIKDENKTQTCKMIIQLLKIITLHNSPANAQLLFEEYRTLKPGPLTTEEQFALGYPSYGLNALKFKQLIKQQTPLKQTITKNVYKNAILTVSRNPRLLSENIQDVLGLFLYENKIQIMFQQILDVGIIFRKCQNALIFSRFLEYLLRTQPPMLQQTKRLFFGVLNLAKDQSSKNYLKGLLDLLFDKDRKDQRLKYKQTKETQEKKQLQLQKIKNDALKKINQKKKLQEQQEKLLLKKHGIVIQENPKTQADQSKKQQKKNAKVQASATNIPKIQNKTSPTKNTTPPKTKQAKTNTTNKTTQAETKTLSPSPVQISKKQSKQSQKNINQNKSTGKQNSKQIISIQAPKKPSITTQQVRLNFARKLVRRRGRAKFIDFATTMQELQEDEAYIQNKKSRGEKPSV